MTQEYSAKEPIPGEFAAAHMVTRIPIASVETPVEDVIRCLSGQEFECADTVFVTDREGRLEGIVRINTLFGDGGRRIGEIMEPEHEAARLEDDQEHIAMLAMQLNMIVVPVVDDDGKLVGAVPPESLLEILRYEHMEDIQRLAGITAHKEGPHIALDAPLVNRFARRIPWLIFGLFASFLITLVMVSFEEALSANVAVAFFVPALVYISGAIGTQAVSVSVRGLSNEVVSIGGLLRDELIIGLSIGAALGTLAYFSVFIVFGDWVLSLAVGLAVLGGGAVSSVVGFGLPWIFDHFGSDPAMGSGPICTIIQDAASLIIYFALVSVLII